ncbi:30S ribosomal protein S18 [Meiothermus luteus]|uniref:Small ribosomal subunit protein bS18 n=1 Tax=Meiothermus luteus TaxID=2026184 RepID=A0A399EVF9_9DEIN|nr:30S ribosomal protein S18 [Meiothermus luteus]RMH57486.1 MAG: 30S ribosomal protein S18 [Deinococcota bacterium]
MSSKKVSNRSKERQEKNVRRGRKPKVAAAVGPFDLTDFKNVEILKRFLSETGKILPRRRTGLSAKEQRKLARTIKRARVMGLLPFTEKLVRK